MLILRKQTEQQDGAVLQVTPDLRLTHPSCWFTHHPPGPRRHVVTKLPLDGPRRPRHGELSDGHQTPHQRRSGGFTLSPTEVTL